MILNRFLANVHIPFSELRSHGEWAGETAVQSPSPLFTFEITVTQLSDLNLAPVESKNNQQANEESHGGINATLDADKLENCWKTW